MTRKISLFCFLHIFVLVSAEFPAFLETGIDIAAQTRNEDVAYRLPESVIPVHYDIDLELYFEETAARPYTFDGAVSIIIQAVEENTQQITLHVNVDEIKTITITTENGTPVNLNSSLPFLLEPQYHFIRINLLESMAVNENYLLYITYSNRMNTTPLNRGLWRGYYIDDNGVERVYATTHFQPYNARQVFPCWDEPLFKATFTLHITRPASYGAVYSNTGIESTETFTGNRVKDNFYITPRMSSYLLTFLVSEEFAVLAESNELEVPLRIIGRSNGQGLADHALELAVPLTRYFEEYFGISYASMSPYLKNDHISSPDWASAGTENWGMVSYREMYMFINKSETIISTEHYAATLVSHELAHKWFGNLVTCFWWSNTWINEGYASYFGYMATHNVFPEYELHEHFNSRYLQNSLSFDSGTTVPINNINVNAPAEVTGHFGTISYSKAAAVIRMIADLIQEETFKKANQYFLSNNSFEPAVQEDMYVAYAQAASEDGAVDHLVDFDIADFFRTWVDQVGYPILNVNINYQSGLITLGQERFFISRTATPTDQLWPIPITYSTQSNPQFDNLRADVMMSTANLTLNKDPVEEWVIFNNQQHGHYRVNYDMNSWNILANALRTQPDSIHHLNRAQVVDDVFALMRSNRLTYSQGLDILSFLSQETNYHVWDPAVTGYGWLYNRLKHLPEQQKIFVDHIFQQMQHAIEVLGYDVSEGESATVSLTRQIVLNFACRYEHEGCISDAITKFQAMKNGQWIHPYIRRHVYFVGVREGDSSDFQFLLNRYLASNVANDQLEMLRGLGSAKDPELIQQFMDLTLTKSVRTQDKATALNYALLPGYDSAKVVLDYFKQHADEINEVYHVEAPNRPVHSALSTLASYLSSEDLDDLEEWLRSSQTSQVWYDTGISAVASARANIEWGTSNVDEILSGLTSHAAAATASIIMTLFIPLIIFIDMNL